MSSWLKINECASFGAAIWIVLIIILTVALVDHSRSNCRDLELLCWAAPILCFFFSTSYIWLFLPLPVVFAWLHHHRNPRPVKWRLAKLRCPPGHKFQCPSPIQWVLVWAFYRGTGSSFYSGTMMEDQCPTKWSEYERMVIRRFASSNFQPRDVLMYFSSPGWTMSSLVLTTEIKKVTMQIPRFQLHRPSFLEQ